MSFVDQVWLFGSLMREEPTVGDIDIALVTSRRPEYAEDHGLRERQLDRLMAGRDDVPRSRRYTLLWSAEAWFIDRTLYGTSRHPLLAGVQEGVNDLAALAVPCRLIYDRMRGGRVDDPITPRHPASQGRSAELAPIIRMPDLTPSPIRPMDARWVAGFDRGGVVSPYCIFRGWTDEAHQLFPRYPEGLRVVGDDHDLQSYPWTPRRLNSGSLDGRYCVALINATQFRGTSVVLRRKIVRTVATWSLQARFEHVEPYRSRKRIDLITLPDLAAAAALILAVDAEHMLRRAAEQLRAPKVTIDLREGELSGDMISNFFNLVCGHLAERTVRIEPNGWAGFPVRLICQ